MKTIYFLCVFRFVNGILSAVWIFVFGALASVGRCAYRKTLLISIISVASDSILFTTFVYLPSGFYYL